MRTARGGLCAKCAPPPKDQRPRPLLRYWVERACPQCGERGLIEALVSSDAELDALLEEEAGRVGVDT